MIIKIANNCYQMPTHEAKGLLKVASEQVACGIYAVEMIGKGYIELMNMPLTPKEIKKAVKRYGKQGMKVYFNA